MKCTCCLQKLKTELSQAQRGAFPQLHSAICQILLLSSSFHLMWPSFKLESHLKEQGIMEEVLMRGLKSKLRKEEICWSGLKIRLEQKLENWELVLWKDAQGEGEACQGNLTCFWEVGYLLLFPSLLLLLFHSPNFLHSHFLGSLIPHYEFTQVYSREPLH